MISNQRLYSILRSYKTLKFDYDSLYNTLVSQPIGPISNGPTRTQVMNHAARMAATHSI